MWKWLGGCLIVVIVLAVGGFWWAFRSIQDSTAPDGSISVTIGASPARVYASLAHGDSLASWMADGNKVLTARHGPLQVGDTIAIKIPGTNRDAIRWRVAQVVPDRLVVLELTSASNGGPGASKRDSLVVEGDSTRVVSRILSPLLQPVSQSDSVDPATGAVFDMTTTMVLSMFRMQSKMDLTRLKERIESSAR